ncbi:MAG: universal stress protein [Candidatus Eremiobacteraeota bacterium]|nr:universal stress protein [Candidatus Eremiobacteraeota bacterium]
MFTSILTPVDGSPPSDAAVKLAIATAKAYKAKLLFLYAVAIPLPVHDAGGFAREQIMQEEQTRGDEILGEAMKLAKDAGVAAQTQLVGGSVSEAVLTAADEHACDVIVMGTHGRTGIARAVLGSKTADVIARSPLPVLVAPHLS